MKRLEKRKWTERETKTLYKFLRQGKSAKEIAQSLSRSEKAIRVKVEKLGLSFSDFQMADYNAKCPFFRAVFAEGGIICEGIDESSAVICLFFDVFKQRNHFFSRCAEDYNACPWAQMLLKRYEGTVAFSADQRAK